MTKILKTPRISAYRLRLPLLAVAVAVLANYSLHH